MKNRISNAFRDLFGDDEGDEIAAYIDNLARDLLGHCVVTGSATGMPPVIGGGACLLTAIKIFVADESMSKKDFLRFAEEFWDGVQSDFEEGSSDAL